MYEKINEDLKVAMKEKDTFKLSVLRMLKSALQLEQISKKHELDDNEVSTVLKKQVKIRKDSLAEYEKYGKTDSVKQLEDEIKNIENSEVNMEQEEVPIINNMPNISNVVNNSIDINSLNKPEQIEQLTIDDKKEQKVVTPDTFFSNPEKMPNKFFNFLEDSAANMNTEEITPIVTSKTPEVKAQENLINNTENIEMLDDFFIPETNSNIPVQNEYLDTVIKTVRGLNFDSNKVSMEEMNLPTEYIITIKIKKDKI